ncbi:MAG TPA: glycosyltransferase family 4 protein [Ktedonobacterales bacterium]
MPPVDRPFGERQPRPVAGATHVLMHVLGVGRTDVRVQREATALRDAGYSVTLVDIERDRARPRVETINGIRYHHIISPSYYQRVRFKPWFLVKMAAILARSAVTVASIQADIYHAHDDTALPVCYVAAAARGAQLVFDAHELPLGQTNLRGWRWLKALIRGALRLMTPRCAGIITVSQPIADEIQRQFSGPPPVVVRNIPPYRPPDVASDVIKRALGLPNETRVALYQGAFQANRGLDILVSAARYLDAGHVIVLMGSGPMGAELERLAQLERAGARLRILPPVPYDVLLQWTASADLGLIAYRPSFSLNVRYCLPNKLFEYLMAGVPVVATPLDAVADVLRAYDVGLVAPSTDPESVGRAISAALRDTLEWSRMRRNALAASKADLRWERERERLVSLYAAICGPAAQERGALNAAGGAAR